MLILEYKSCYEQVEKGRIKGSVPQRTPSVFIGQGHFIIYKPSINLMVVSVDLFSISTKNEPSFKTYQYSTGVSAKILSVYVIS